MVDAPEVVVTWHRVECGDAAGIGDALAALYFANRTRPAPRLGAVAGRFRIDGAEIDGLRAHRIRSGIPHTVEVADSGDQLLAVTVESGCLTSTVGGCEQRHGAGAIVLVPQGSAFAVASAEVTLDLIGLPMARVRRAVGDQYGPAACAGFRFTGGRPVTAAAARYWHNLAVAVHQELLHPDTALARPRLTEQAVTTLATAAIEVFAHTAGPVLHGEPVRAEPTAIERAVEYLHAHPAGPISIDRLAEAAGVTARALQYGFRTRYGTTPTDYHRRVRLEHAHRELLTADPAGGATVAAIASRWGFTNPGRFALRYRQLYGYAPSTTLHS